MNEAPTLRVVVRDEYTLLADDHARICVLLEPHGALIDLRGMPW